MRVKYIKDGRTRGWLNIGIVTEDGLIKLNAPLSLCSHLTVGDEIGNIELDALKDADESYRALKRALSLLAASDKSAATLRIRLLGLGFSSSVAEDAVRECVRLGYLNEERQIEAQVLREARALRGPRLILRRLVARGYPMSRVRETVRSLEESGDLDFDASFRILAKRKGISDPEELRALAYRSGFHSSSVRAMLAE